MSAVERFRDCKNPILFPGTSARRSRTGRGSVGRADFGSSRRRSEVDKSTCAQCYHRTSRAGEAGQAFSVVAKEVKTLASQTASATMQISTALRQLTAQVERLLKEGRANVERSKVVREGTESINSVFGAIRDSMARIDSEAHTHF